MTEKGHEGNITIVLIWIIAIAISHGLPWWLRWQRIQVQSLGWEDPLEKEMATHSSTLAWRIS